MMLGFWVVSGLPLSSAVWLIPALYLVRAVMMMRALSLQIKLTLFDVFRAMRGGVILAGFAIGTWFVLGLIDMNGNVFNIMRLVMCAFVCATALYLSRGWLLGV